MLPIDYDLTKGSYWGGAQIPFWILMIVTIIPITGALGIDHLILRSPWTALLKALSIIPLFGFWYFFDVAQVVGEREYVEENGFAIPFYGPRGIGAGIFTGERVPVSPPDKPRPWIYVAYVLASIFFLALPVNKLIIGDYYAAVHQAILFLVFPFTFTAITWGLYDVYRIFFDTKGLFEEGPHRIPPLSWIINPYYDRSVMGPLGPRPDENFGVIRTIKKYIFTAREVADGAASIATVKASAEKAIGNFVPTLTASVAQSAATVAPAVAESVGRASIKLSEQVPEFTKKIADLGLNIGKSATVVGVELSKAGAKVAADLPETIRELGPMIQKQTQPTIDKSIKTMTNITTPAVKSVANAVDSVADTTKALSDKSANIIRNTSGAVGNVTDDIKRTAKSVSNSAINVVQSSANSAQSIAQSVENSAKVVSKSTANAIEAVPGAVEKLGAAGQTIQKGGGALQAINSFPNTIRQRAIIIRNGSDKIHDAIVDLQEQIPGLLSTAITDTGDIIVTGADTAVDSLISVFDKLKEPENAAAAMAGGAMVANSGPAISSATMLFCVALLAAGGYTMYLIRKGLKAKKDIRSDDSPPDASRVRKNSTA